MTRRVFAIDPGDTTGWALLEAPEDEPAGIPTVIEFGQIGGQPLSQAKFLWEKWWVSCDRPRADIGVVIEDFQVRTMSVRLSPVQVSHAFLGFRAARAGVESVVWQMPAMAKTTATDERMRAWGLWQPGKPHANDAIRHGVVALRRAARDPKIADQLDSK